MLIEVLVDTSSLKLASLQRFQQGLFLVNLVAGHFLLDALENAVPENATDDASKLRTLPHRF